MNRKILIIGGSGFIGSHFQEAYPQELIVNMDIQKPLFTAKTTFVQGDIRKYADLDNLLSQYSDCDTVINLAAEHQDFGLSKEAFHKTNVYGAEMLCKAATKHGIKNIIFYSSVAVYGNNRQPSNEETSPNPINDYGHSKLLAEGVYETWAAKDPLRKVLVIRPAVVYGERNVANMYRLIQQIRKGLYFHIGKGKNIKSIVYVKNIVAATFYLMERMQTGVHIYNYADDEQLSSREIADTIATTIGKRKLITLPYWMVYCLGLPFDLLIKLTGKNLPVSTNRIIKLCTETYHTATKIKSAGFRALYKNKEGLARMISWMNKTTNDNIVLHNTIATAPKKSRRSTE